MKRTFIKPAAILTGAMLTMAAVALPTFSGQSDDIPTISEASIKAHMAFLATDEMMGRDTGSPEYQKAAEYVADFYKDIGLKPIGENGTYFQGVPFAKHKPNQEKSSFSVNVDGEDFTLPEGNFVMSGNIKYANKWADADLVFVGYGIHAPELGHDDFAGLDVKDKIIVRLIGTPEGISPELARVAGLKKTPQGAAGILGVMTPNVESQVPFKGYYDFFAAENMQMLFDVGEGGEFMYAVTSSKGASEMFKALGSDLESAIKAAGAKDFKGYSFNTNAKMTQVTDLEHISSPNVMAVLEGSDPQLKNEYVVISAHLDHVGGHCQRRANDTAKDGDTICNGAMDNASGTATTMEVAKAFANMKVAPKRSVIFLHVTAEEKGLLGAQWFANNPTVPADSLVADVNLDMPVLLYDFADVVAFGAEHSTIGEIARPALAKIGVGLADDPMPEENLFQRSDHYRFVEKGIPSVFLMTGPTAVGDDTSLPPKERNGYATFRKFLDTNYHSPADDLSQPIRYDVAAKYAVANYLIIEALANAETAPRWYEGNEFGDRFAPGKPRAKKK